MTAHSDALDPADFRFRARDADCPLARRPTRERGPFAGEDEARRATAETARRLAEHQAMLEAHGTHGVLIVLQGMDAAGKDEAVHHVTSVIDPGSAAATSFASMSGEEARQDYLRRAAEALPARGELAIFNRSYYERAVSDRVSPELLEAQRLPPEALEGVEDGRLWERRLRQIRDFERYLVENGIHPVKLFFHVSAEVQRERLLERIERPEERWDFSRADIEKRRRWDAFLEAYDLAFRATDSDGVPWHVIPADEPWFARAAAAAIILGKLRSLHDDFPEPDDERRELLAWGRRQLEDEGGDPDA